MIAKNKVKLQLTFPKEDAQNLQSLQDSFAKEGIEVSKSQILLKAFRDYLNIILAVGLSEQDKKQEKVEEPHKENKDA